MRLLFRDWEIVDEISDCGLRASFVKPRGASEQR